MMKTVSWQLAVVKYMLIDFTGCEDDQCENTATI